MTDLLIAGGTVFTPDGPRPLDVHVSGERVERLQPWGSARSGELVDATDLLVLPGAIDAHVHSRDPGWPEKETFASLTAAAAAGGVTTVLDMPNSMPGVDSLGVFQAKAQRAASQAAVDFGLWGLLRATSTPEHLDGLSRAGAIGFKAYLGYAWRRSLRQVVYSPSLGDPDLEAPPGYGTLARLAPEIARLGRPLAVHCEDPDLLAAFARPVSSYGDILAGRPALAEAVGVAAAGTIAWATGAHLHVCHLSSELGLEAVRRLQGTGLRMTVETCPQYLWLSDADYDRLGTLLKMYPPVRTGDDRAALRQGLLLGEIGMVASDHAPHTDAEKLGSNLSQAAPGNPGVQTLLLSCLELAREIGDLPAAVRWVCEAPARAFGLHPRKGVIQPGSDADIVLVDPQARTAVEVGIMHSRQRHSALSGLEFRFAIRAVYLRGQPTGPARGQLITPL